MSTLTLVVPKVFPASGPLRIIVSVPGPLLHHFDSDLTENVERKDLMRLGGHPVSHRIAQMAANTCQRSDFLLREVVESFMEHSANDSWDLVVKVDCSVPSTESDPFIAYFQANKELDDEGQVEFIPIVPRTARARAKYQVFHDPGDLGEDMDAELTISL